MRRALNNVIPLNKTRILKTLRLDLTSVEDFYIELDDAHKTYRPGEEVKGQVILQLKKNIIDVAITLSLLGSVRLKNLSPSSSWRSSKKQRLFNHTIMLYGGEDEAAGDSEAASNGLTRGEHRFPFIVKLPRKNVYTSISFEKGAIRYSLKASLCDLKDKQLILIQDEDTKKMTNNTSLLTCEKYLNIVKPINVALFPQPKPKTVIMRQTTKKSKKTASSASTINSAHSEGSTEQTQDMITPPHEIYEKPKVKVTVTLQDMGYLRGEVIPIKINVQHLKQIRNLNGIVVTLIRICRMDMDEDSAIQSFRKDLSQAILPLYIDPVTNKCEMNTSLRVPVDAFPTIVGCEMVSFQYFVEVLVNMSNSKSPSSALSLAPQESELDEESIEDVTTKQPGHRRQSIETPVSLGGWNSETSTNTNIFIVDKLKRMKNVMTVSHEVIVGTERKTSRKHADTESHSTPVSSRPSTAHNTVTPCSMEGSSSTNSPPTTSSPDNVADNMSQMVMTPGYEQPPFPVDYSSSTHSSPPELPSVPPQPDGVNEKEMMRLREQALMPSEPMWSNNSSNIDRIVAPELPEDSHLMEYADLPPPLSVDGVDDDDEQPGLDYVPTYVRGESSLNTIHEDA